MKISLEETIRDAERDIQKNDLDKALDKLNSVLEMHPENPFALNDKGVALNILQKYEEAILVFEKILNLDPENSNAAYNLIMNLMALKRWEEARQVFSKYGNLFNEDDRKFINSEIGTNISSERSIGNMPDYLNSFTRINHRLEDLYSQPIFFIVGSPKSGTTWLENMLNGHPDIHCFSESNLLKYYVGLDQVCADYDKDVHSISYGIGKNAGYCTFGRENLNRIYIYSILLLIAVGIDNRPGAKIYGMKNPDLLKAIDVLSKLFPNFRFIHIIRDGRDVINSGWHHNRRVNVEFRENGNLREYAQVTAKYWKFLVENGLRFEAQFPDKMHRVHYELLQKNPADNLKGIFRFLDVNDADQVVQKAMKAGEFSRLSGGRKKGQEDKYSFFRKGVVGDWQNLFDEETEQIFYKETGELLSVLGYK